MLNAVHQDARGFLWVSYSVARDAWKRAMEHDFEDCCYSVIEVLDPSTGALVATATVPGFAEWILDGQYILTRDTNGWGGESWLPLYRARLSVPGR